MVFYVSTYNYYAYWKYAVYSIDIVVTIYIKIS